MMFASIAVESPDRAAAALAALTRGARFRFAAGRRAASLVELPVSTPLSVEQVVELACRLGFHAEEVRLGVLEFWIDEWTILEVLTPEAAPEARRLLLAA
jgi:hypothetical protein